MPLLFLILNFLLLFFPQLPGGSCGCEDKPQVNTLAAVNGTKITKAELGVDAQNKISQLQGEVIKARESELDRQINRLLLETEARKRGITAEQLLLLEVVGKVPDPTEAEIQAFYDERKQAFGKDLKRVRPQIIQFIRSEREALEAMRLSNSLKATANLIINIPRVTPPANEFELSRVFATVNGRTITSRDIEASLQPLILKVQQQVYLVRKEDLDLRINDLLLDQEARKRNIAPSALLTGEVRGKLPIITDQQARSFYDQNKPKFKYDFSEVKLQIIEYLTAQEERKLANAFAAQLRENSAVQIYLTPPESPAFKIDIADQPTRGNLSAKVTVVEFTDFECQACAKEQFDFERLILEFGAQVRFVVRDFPLAQHPNALRAALAAEAAREQGKYWEYVSVLYANQLALQDIDLKKYASQLSLDRTRFDAALDNKTFNGKVQRDIQDGTKLGVFTVPVFFVNGQQVTDYSYQSLKTAIQTALNRSN